MCAFPFLRIEWVAPFFRVTDDVVAWGVVGTAGGRGSHHLTVVGSAVCIRQALSAIESAIRLELTEVGTCTLEELSERLLYYSWNQVFSAADRLSRQGTVPPPAGGLVRPHPFARTMSIPEARYVNQV